jgi:hypothetical protein
LFLVLVVVFVLVLVGQALPPAVNHSRGASSNDCMPWNRDRKEADRRSNAKEPETNNPNPSTTYRSHPLPPQIRNAMTIPREHS